MVLALMDTTRVQSQMTNLWFQLLKYNHLLHIFQILSDKRVEISIVLGETLLNFKCVKPN